MSKKELSFKDFEAAIATATVTALFNITGHLQKCLQDRSEQNETQAIDACKTDFKVIEACMLARFFNRCEIALDRSIGKTLLEIVEAERTLNHQLMTAIKERWKL